ncbi:MAG: DUF2905 family protein, partial [Armatimonadetes bacterium]|nr:DUF2905 family protein [Armatimonadota bacterium]
MTEPLEIMGRMMLLFGVLMLAIGGFMIFLARLGAGSGLPGDIIVRRP